MKFYLDTEFIEAGRTAPIQLISIGMVSEAGDTYYAISGDFKPEHASEWVQQNVLAKLEPKSEVPRKSVARIAEEVRNFIAVCSDAAGKNEPPTFYGYYSAYDHVVFCQMFGAMVDLPPGWPMFTRDLIQTAKETQARIGVDAIQLVGKPVGEHNALADAQWNKRLAEELDRLQKVTQKFVTGVWPVGTVIPATVEACTEKTLIVIDGRYEGHVILGTGHDATLQPGQKGKIIMVEGGPTGGHWEFVATIDGKPAAVAM